MEYLGYIAANNPPPNYYLRRAYPPSSPPPLQQENSSQAASSSKTKKKRLKSDNIDSRGPNKSSDCSLGRLSIEFASSPTGPVTAPQRHPQESQASRRDKELPQLPRPSSRGPAGAGYSESAAYISNRPCSPSSPILPSSAPLSPSLAVPPTSPTAGLKRKTNRIRKLPRHYTKDEDDLSSDPSRREHDLESHPLIKASHTYHQHNQDHQPSYVSVVPKHISNPHTQFENTTMSAMTGALALSSKGIAPNELRIHDSTGGSGGEGLGGEGSSQSLFSIGSEQAKAKPYMVRNGRTYLSDPTSSYCLPVDMPEQNRQSLRSLLLFQLFGGPVCSPNFANKPPKRVLEVACGNAFWSIMCNQYFARQGHKGISFTGIDIAPMCMGLNRNENGRKAGASLISGTGANKSAGAGADTDKMDWRFVQQDIRRYPWPFEPEEFDLIILKDISLTVRSEKFQLMIDECIRLLEPGGTFEIWDADHAVRLLRPHYPVTAGSVANREDDEYDSAASAGAYVITPKTPLSSPQNPYMIEYNSWLQKAFMARSIPPSPCALASAFFLQEVETLKNASMRRLAVPLSEMRWEREGVGGVVTKDGKTYVESKGKAKSMGPGASSAAAGTEGEQQQGKKKLTAAQTALRRTALLTVIQLIQSLEPVLREVSGKSQDEWDGWSGKMINNLMKENGTFWGECLEVGAWWAEKR